MLAIINPWHGCISKNQWALYNSILALPLILIYQLNDHGKIFHYLALYQVISLWFGFSITANRLRAVGKSAWWVLLIFAPPGMFYLLYCCLYKQDIASKTPRAPKPEQSSALQSIDFSNYQMPPQPSSGFAPRQRAEARPAPFAKPMGTRPAPTGFGRRGL